MKAVSGTTGKTPLPGPGEAWDPIRLTRWSGEYLEGKGVENGRLDAELLLAGQVVGPRVHEARIAAALRIAS